MRRPIALVNEMSLDDENNWQTIYNQFYSVTGKNLIGKVSIPGIFTQHTIRIYASSLIAKRHWWLAGDLSHLLGSSQPDFEGSRWRVPLNKIMLVQLPKLTTSYRLKFEVPRWHKEIAVVVEAYTGE
jgi:hypothetical protein